MKKKGFKKECFLVTLSHHHIGTVGGSIMSPKDANLPSLTYE